jgi:hypothetical protein
VQEAGPLSGLAATAEFLEVATPSQPHETSDMAASLAFYRGLGLDFGRSVVYPTET